jgi:UDP-2,3-diacylglucosamine hydrolase
VAVKALFVSDVHLSPAAPAEFRSFLRFLDETVPGVDRLYVLGDLFDIWVGPRQALLPCFDRVLSRFRDLRERGTRMGFVRGNRDFLLAGPCARDAGLEVLPDRADVEIAGRRLILTHGDLLCTRDRAYHRMRRVIRSGPARAAMRRLPLGLALRLARGFRWASVAEVARKSDYRMGLDLAEARAWLEGGADAIICGHVHRGERYRFRFEGRTADLISLPAWDRSPGYAELSDAGLSLRSASPSPPAAGSLPG